MDVTSCLHVVLSSLADSGFESFVLTFTGLADTKTYSLRGMSQLHVPNYHHWRKNVALTHPAVVHEKASFQLRASSDDISICDRRESLRERLSIGSTLLLYANTASRIAETWAFLLAGCGCLYIFTWHRVLRSIVSDQSSPALTANTRSDTNTKLITVDQCWMFRMAATIAGCNTVCIKSTIVLLICHWTNSVHPSELPVATWEFKSAGQTPPPRWQQPHPGRVNIGIAKSHRDVTQVEDRTLIRAKMLPHIN
jgi:hypothetical protein